MGLSRVARTKDVDDLTLHRDGGKIMAFFEVFLRQHEGGQGISVTCSYELSMVAAGG